MLDWKNVGPHVVLASPGQALWYTYWLAGLMVASQPPVEEAASQPVPALGTQSLYHQQRQTAASQPTAAYTNKNQDAIPENTMHPANDLHDPESLAIARTLDPFQTFQMQRCI